MDDIELVEEEKVSWGYWETFQFGKNVPRPRHLHSCVVFNDCAYVFGGFSQNDEFLNDLWCYNAVKNSWVKKAKLNISGIKGIHSHSAVLYKGNMLVWGGSIMGEVSKRLFQYSFSRNVWIEIILKYPGLIQPRWGHTAVIHEHFMVIFGGCNDNHSFSDVFLIYLRTFECTISFIEGEIPQERSFHSADIIGNKMVVVSGDLMQPDVCVLNLKNIKQKILKWKIYAMKGMLPRKGHASVVVGDSLVIHSGRSKREILSDLYLFDLDTKYFIQVDQSTDGPGGIFFHSLFKIQNTLYIFGGIGKAWSGQTKVDCLNLLMGYHLEGTFEVIPMEIIVDVLSYLEPVDLCRFGATCSYLYHACGSDKIWKKFQTTYNYTNDVQYKHRHRYCQIKNSEANQQRLLAQARLAKHIMITILNF